MLAILGVNYYGTREAAKLRDDKKSLSALFVDLLCINSISTAFAYVLFFIICFSIDGLYGYRNLLLIYSLSIALIGLGMEWLYQGLEKYKFIALRAVLFQIFAIVLMVLFVKTSDDLHIYAVLMVTATYGYNFINIICCKKYISVDWKYKPNIKKHIKPILWLFAFVVSMELYTVLDSTMLGAIKGDESVGLYTAAIKINKIAVALIDSIGVVLIPRLSYYIGNKDRERSKALINKAYNYGFMLSVPVFIGLLLLSDEIIYIFSGSGFESATLTMRIITPIVLIIPFSVMTNQQTLIPLGKEKPILVATMCAAVTNILMNSILIPSFRENGAAIATVFAELVAAIVSYFNARKYIGIEGIFSNYHQYIIASLPIIPIKIAVSSFFAMDYLVVFLTTILSIVSYVFTLHLLRNEYIDEFLDMMRIKLGLGS